MAEKRMFTKKITESDSFLDMPCSTQCLYFHLNLNADDDGFINNPKKIQRMIGGNDDDMKLLITKKFIIPFESGVVVIKHWLMHNLIRKDRYTETDYIEEKKQLEIKGNKAYSWADLSNWQPDDNQMATTGCRRLGKDRLGKSSIEEISTLAQSDLENPSMPEQKIIITLTLNNKTEYEVVENQVQEWQELYPSVDIVQELRKMKGWLDANVSKRKTRRGILRFINAWLAREQDKGGSKNARNEIPIAGSVDRFGNKIF